MPAIQRINDVRVDAVPQVEVCLDCPTCGESAAVGSVADGSGAGVESTTTSGEVICLRCAAALFLDPILPRRHRESARRAA